MAAQTDKRFTRVAGKEKKCPTCGAWSGVRSVRFTSDDEDKLGWTCTLDCDCAISFREWIDIKEFKGEDPNG